jgi:hypothetical protein
VAVAVVQDKRVAMLRQVLVETVEMDLLTYYEQALTKHEQVVGVVKAVV